MTKKIDKINANEYATKGEQGTYICKCCGKEVSYYDCISHLGYNLICNKCVIKIRDLTGDMHTASTIQKRGQQLAILQQQEKDGIFF